MPSAWAFLSGGEYYHCQKVLFLQCITEPYAKNGNFAIVSLMKVIIGADHRGFKLKEFLKKELAHTHEVEDVGALALDSSDDYTLYAEKVALLVSSDLHARGILLCGSGVGVEVVANKFDGVRAGIGISEEHVLQARAHDDMNVLVLAADFVSHQAAEQMVKTFLKTDFDHKARHTRRLEEIEKIEENN